MSKPLISIITLSLNAEKHIRDTIKSITHQTYKNIEYIIIDGGSTDSTINIIKEYGSGILRWVSEPDNGISDAMNKGIKLATGDFILFIHADDYLVSSDIIEQAVNAIEMSNHDIYHFKVLLDDGISKTISSNKELGFLTNFKMGSCHQGQFCSRKLFETIGNFDTSLKICMDYDLILRAYRHGLQSRAIDLTLSVMRLMGISSRQDWKGLKARFDEERVIHYKNTRDFWQILMYKVFWGFYLKYRKFKFHSDKV